MQAIKKLRHHLLDQSGIIGEGQQYNQQKTPVSCHQRKTSGSLRCGARGGRLSACDRRSVETAFPANGCQVTCLDWPGRQNVGEPAGFEAVSSRENLGDTTALLDASDLLCPLDGRFGTLQANSSWTTEPSTSVRRKSRPA